MNKLFYPKLALTNIKKNSQTYIPYMITCICTMMMFYIMHAISINKGLYGVNGSESLIIILDLGMIVIGIFSAIFLFYTNSFLIKRRKKELGLYNVLGMEKKHIAKILFYENVFTSCISLAIGLSGGIVLNKFMFMLLLKLLAFDVPYGFEIPLSSLGITASLFILIFFVTLLTNLVQIKMANPMALLKGGQQGEKEPKTRWIKAITGVISLSLGYGIALSVETPLEAINLFFVAVILVMIGTYELFTAGSIALLKLLRKNKKFYYKSKNFISVSGMMYRMKQNAVGLANICILSTAVLVMLSTTFSLYVGMEDALRYRFPRDISIGGGDLSEDDVNLLNELVDRQLEDQGIIPTNKVNYYNKADAYSRADESFILGNNNAYSTDFSILGFVSLADYNRLEGKHVTLAQDEVLIFSSGKNYGKDKITIEGQPFNVKEELETLVFKNKNEMDMIDTYILIVNDIDRFGEESTSYQLDFDVESSDEEEVIVLSQLLYQKFRENNLDVSLECMAANREDFLSLYGGLFFLGLFLGTLFLMATVLIIYYKQVSEGYDDKERFNIMQKVGMSKTEIKKTIRTQVLMVFFLPLVFTIIHIAFAFPIITKLLAMLNLINTPLFLFATIITVLIFTVIYGVVFLLTARTYYKIVE
ncbi:MAG: FtsX-like permease family protein [Turicibacter sp.]